MEQANKTFEAIMRGKGYTDFSKNSRGKYVSQVLQVRWSYFLLGWEMRGAA